MKISKRARQIAPSPTLSLNAIVNQLKAEGEPVINLTAGELDSQTPKQVKKAGIEAIEKNQTRYTPTAGVMALRQAVADKFWKVNKIKTKPDQVVVGVGAKQLLYHSFQVLCNPKDEVILSLPTWTTYVEQIKLAGAKPVTIKLKPPFRLTAERIRRVLTKRSKVLLLNSPANPTGAMISRSELVKIAKLAVAKNLTVVSDEIYEYLTFGEQQISIASLNKEAAEQTITISGVSKTYAMTGWRLGYATGPEAVMKKMAAIQSQTTSNTSSISQAAATKALTGSQKAVEKVRKRLAERREYLSQALKEIPGLRVIKPEGAFYFFINIEKLLGKKFKTSAEWCEKLLKEFKVAVVPGEAFLAPGYFRLSMAASMAELKKAVKEIKNFVKIYG